MNLLDQWAAPQISAFASLVTMGIAAFALMAAGFQILTARAASALESHRQYIRLCVEQADISNSLIALKTIKRPNWHDILKVADDQKTANEDVERYLWVLSFVLNNCEQVMLALPWSRHWRFRMKTQLSYHYGALREVWPNWRPQYAQRTQKLVDELLAESHPD